MNDLIAKVESKYMKKEIPAVEPGDTVRVQLQVTEGEGEEQSTRSHTFEGTVIACRGGGINRSITVRRVTFGIGVERTFPLHSPTVTDVEIVRRAQVRRAKLYYLRGRHERAARLKERKTAPRAATVPEAEAEAEETVPEAEAEVPTEVADESEEAALALVAEEETAEGAEAEVVAEEEAAEETKPEEQPEAADEEPS